MSARVVIGAISLCAAGLVDWALARETTTHSRCDVQFELDASVVDGDVVDVFADPADCADLCVDQVTFGDRVTHCPNKAVPRCRMTALTRIEQETTTLPVQTFAAAKGDGKRGCAVSKSGACSSGDNFCQKLAKAHGVSTNGKGTYCKWWQKDLKGQVCQGLHTRPDGTGLCFHDGKNDCSERNGFVPVPCDCMCGHACQKIMDVGMDLPWGTRPQRRTNRRRMITLRATAENRAGPLMLPMPSRLLRRSTNAQKAAITAASGRKTTVAMTATMKATTVKLIEVTSTKVPLRSTVLSAPIKATLGCPAKSTQLCGGVFVQSPYVGLFSEVLPVLSYPEVQQNFVFIEDLPAILPSALALPAFTFETVRNGFGLCPIVEGDAVWAHHYCAMEPIDFFSPSYTFAGYAAKYEAAVMNPVALVQEQARVFSYGEAEVLSPAVNIQFSADYICSNANDFYVSNFCSVTAAQEEYVINGFEYVVLSPRKPFVSVSDVVFQLDVEPEMAGVFANQYFYTLDFQCQFITDAGFRTAYC